MRGYIGLISVLFVGAVGTVIATTVILLGLASSRSSFAVVQSNQAKAAANACAEEALQRIRDFVPFSGSGTLTLASGSCNYSVTKGTGHNRTVAAAGFVGSVVRRVGITIDTINPAINITSWQEVE